MGGAAPNTLTSTQTNAIGYLGGGILAICLIPQVAKVVMTRSARDISISWSVLYSIGLMLSLAYLILMGAIAAWIPIIFEIAGCLIVLFLKFWYEHTAAGRRFSAAKQQQQRELPLDDISAWDQQQQQQQQQDGQAQDRSVRAHGAAAAAALGSSGDISWRGRAVLGQHQEAPSGLVIPMVDVSVRNGSRHGSRNGSMHGNMHGHDTANGSQQDVSAAGRQEQEGTQQKLGAAPNKAAGAAGPDSACDNSTALEVRCIGTSVGSASTTSIPAAATSEGLPCFTGGVSQHVQASAAAGALYRSSVQQQQQPIEPLFASTWPHQAVEPMHVPKGGR